LGTQIKSTTSERETELHNAILRYLDQGLCIIPCGMTDKTPLIKWRDFQNHLPTEEDVAGWFRSWADFNLAVVTGAVSGIVILDADTPEAVEWCKSNRMTSPVAVGSRRGMHYYFRHPGGGMRFKNAQAFRGVNSLDVRADGGYALLPPSISRSIEKGDYHYRWSFTGEWEDMPVWRGEPALADVTLMDAATFEFDQLNLAGVDVQGDGGGVRAEQLAQKFMAEHGRKMGDGDGRNTLMVKLAGQKIRLGIIGEALERVCRQFQEDYFAEPMEEAKFLNCLRSASDMDRRNHPSEYAPDGSRKVVGEHSPKPSQPTLPKVEGGPEQALPILQTKDLPKLAADVAAMRWMLDPWFRSAEISQVFAYTGVGKSIFTLAACWHLAIGKDFGPFTCGAPARTLYFDWENGAGTLSDRMEQLKLSYGDPGGNLCVWSNSVHARRAGDINLLTDAGLGLLKAYCQQVQPEVLVIDTIRSAFPGLKENEAHEWTRFNQLVKALRNAGVTVLALHHANKPTELGQGREAGSTHQLSEVEVQVRLTPVFETEEEAAQHVGIVAPEKVQAIRRKGVGPTDRLISCIQVGWGKQRSNTENRRTFVMGFCESDDGRQFIVSESSPMQKAIAVRAANPAAPIETIWQWLWDSGCRVSRRAVRRWLGEN
jgi:hypothetical protein